MGNVHNALNRGPLGQALKNAIGDTKAEGMLERWGETLQPTMDLWSMPEWAFLRQESLWTCRLTRAADAANASIAGIMLPTASRFLVVVEGVTARNAAGAAVWLSMLNRATIAALGGFALGNPPFFRDQRSHETIGAQFAPVETFTALTGALPLNGIAEEQFTLATGSMIPFLTPPYIVRPGGGLFVQTSAINQVLTCNFWGRVRSALPTELKS